MQMQVFKRFTKEHKLRDSKKRMPRESKKRMPWRISGLKREDVTEGWIKVPTDNLYNLHSSPDIIRVIKLWRMRYVWHVAQMGEKKSTSLIDHPFCCTI